MGRRGGAALAAIVVTTVTVAAPVVANASDAPATNEATDPAARETRADTELILLPTHVIADGSSQWIRVAQTLDAFLTDTAQDLGLTVALQDSSGKHHVGEADLPQLASEHGSLVLLAVVRVGKNTDTVALRLSLARPGTRVLVTRVAEANADSLEVRAAVMLRDLRRAARAAGEDIPDDRTPTTALPVPAHSPGRAILATNGTLYGAFVGYSLQRSSASDDPRLLYPLLAVGAGVGLGGAIIIADEWDVGVGEAWYLAAGAWWPAVAGHLIHEGRFGDAPGASADEAWSLGIAAAVPHWENAPN